MTLFFQYVVEGLQSGVVYAALALAVVLLYRGTGFINFAQGDMAMFATFGTWALYHAGLPIVLSVLGAMIGAFLFAALLERVLIRRVARNSHLAAVIGTLGLALALEAGAQTIWGLQEKGLPSLFPKGSFRVGGVVITETTIGMLILLIVLALALYALFQRTKIGLAMRAVTSNPESSQLAGVSVGHMNMIAWGLAALLGALAGGLIVPIVSSFDSGFMQAPMVLAWAGATLGGFDSPVGAVVGGLLVGVVGSLTAGYGSPQLQIAAAFVVILVVLMFRPTGLFGTSTVQRV